MNFNQLDSTIETKPEHEVKVNNRKDLEINGVKELDSFDSEEFLMETTMGYLIVRGNNLQLQNLNVEDGIVHIREKFMNLPILMNSVRKKLKVYLANYSDDFACATNHYANNDCRWCISRVCI